MKKGLATHNKIMYTKEIKIKNQMEWTCTWNVPGNTFRFFNNLFWDKNVKAITK